MIRIRSCSSLGAAIRDRRESNGTTQADLARQAGVSRQWLSQLENGKTSVEFGMVLVVLGVLGLHIGLAPADTERRRPSATDVLLASTAE